MTAPTERESSVLRYLHRHHRLYGWMPSRRELLDHLGISATSLKWVQQILAALETKGFIEVVPKQPRCIRLTKAGLRFVRGPIQEATP